MIITIKAISEELKEDGNPKHIEWEVVGADGKEIKVKLYPAIKIGDEWLRFEDRWDEFKNAHNKSYDIERASIKQEGNRVWKPVIKAMAVKDVFKQKVQEQLQTGREQSIETQVAIKEVGEDWRTGKRKDGDALVIAREQWLMTHLRAEEEVKDDKTKEKVSKATGETRQEDVPTEWSEEEWIKNLNKVGAGNWLKIWCKEKEIEYKANVKELKSSLNIEQLYELRQEVKRRLESD